MIIDFMIEMRFVTQARKNCIRNRNLTKIFLKKTASLASGLGGSKLLEVKFLSENPIGFF